MRLWFLQPWPLPIPAPSLVGFFTTNAILALLLMFLEFFLPIPSIFGRQFKTPASYMSMVIIPVGLDVLRIWGNINELPIDFLWSAAYIGCFLFFWQAAIRLKKARSR